MVQDKEGSVDPKATVPSPKKSGGAQDPYTAYAQLYADLLQTDLPVPTAGLGPSLEPELRPERRVGQKLALLFMPHPDDEVLMGGLPLRLQSEAGWQVIDVALTLGSNEKEQKRRAGELRDSLSLLGFDGCLIKEGGIGKVSPSLRAQEPAGWSKRAELVRDLLLFYRPELIIVPHAGDVSPRHKGCHYVVMDALALMPADFSCGVCFSEYWAPNKDPNLYLGLSVEAAGHLLKALCSYGGELSRNPYHLRFPSYLSDNVRRGSETIQEAGAPGIDDIFAMMYRVDRWEQGHLRPYDERCIWTAATQITDQLRRFGL